MQSGQSSLNHQVIYEIYVRNHGPHGHFGDVIDDLTRIKSLGVDIIWLMPIHPIGQKQKKGSLGCPYSIQDYRAVNPEYGNLEDFKSLLEKAHELGLKVMIDVVYNHTSHDSVLVQNHPDWFHQDENGVPMTTVPAWTDIIDLKHPNPALTAYLMDTLCYWSKMGVDGFRCDVASVLPIEFWIEAKRRVESINPDTIWLAESVHTSFVISRREQGLLAHSDAELYQAFDLTYDYDIWPIWQAAVKGKVPVKRYLEMLTFQRGYLPSQHIKMRCVENHDQPRIMAFAGDKMRAKAWTAFQVFNQGPFLIYAGQESAAEHTPSLFDKDIIQWRDVELQDWFKGLLKIKKLPIFFNTEPRFIAAEPAIQVLRAPYKNDKGLLGIFRVSGENAEVSCALPDGDYRDLVSGNKFAVAHNVLNLDKQAAVILEIPLNVSFSELRFDLM